MAFTTETIAAPPTGRALAEPSEFDLPAKEFVGYDPSGTTSVTGSPLRQAQKEIPRQPDKVEAPAEVTLSPKISALARKEQQNRQREAALKVREEKLASQLADAEAYAKLKAKIAAKDYSAADELGLTYEEHMKYELDKETAKDPREDRVRKLEEELKSFKKANEEKVGEEYKANQALWKQEITKAVSENEEFSTIKELNAIDLVLQHVNESFDEDGVELTVEQAAKEIEEVLLARAEKFANLSKIKNRQQDVKVLGGPKSSTKTITQNLTTTSLQAKPKPFHMLSESEQIAEAIRRVQAEKMKR